MTAISAPDTACAPSARTRKASDAVEEPAAAVAARTSAASDMAPRRTSRWSTSSKLVTTRKYSGNERNPARAGADLCPYCACADARTSSTGADAPRAPAASRAYDTGRRQLGRAARMGLRAGAHAVGVHRLVHRDAAERPDAGRDRLAHRSAGQARLLH